MTTSVLLLAALVVPSQAARHKTHGARSEEEALSGFTQMTASGCECTSACDAGAGDGYRCDSCSTRGCGKFGVTGRYDFCVYPSQETFDSQTFSQKLDYYKAKLDTDPSIRVEYPGSLDTIISSFQSSVHTTFDNFLPEMPATREKKIHTIGAVCGIDFVVSSSPYTGLLSRGTHKGFVRIGTAGKPEAEGIVPGVGFKFPRTGVPAGDFVAMHSTNPGQSHNFFAMNMSNHVAPAEGGLTILAQIFERATICSTSVGLSDFARYTQRGTESSPPKFPFKLFFSPSPDVQMTETFRNAEQLISEFAKWPVGTELFTVFACDSPTDSEDEAPLSLDNCGGRKQLGKISFNSKCSASAYGDQEFHIRHQRIEEDWGFKPEFKQTGQVSCGRSPRDWAKGSPARCEGAPEMLSSDA